MGVGVGVGEGVTVGVGVLVGPKTGSDAPGKLHARMTSSITQMGRYFRLMGTITISRLINALNWSYVQLISFWIPNPLSPQVRGRVREIPQ